MTDFLFPIVISVAITVVLLGGLLFSAFFLDFIKDSWKIPFAVVIDVIDFMTMINPAYLGGVY